ncbi:hypothetical protein [uncultured Clostridium sp.]|uniref:hypothetical protein n=1 Tax=uncultured Clostridium sp. TaxID=59620 RepID=UPI00272E339B|nr:hypothetical protein [uncultured Clostridium sp.]
MKKKKIMFLLLVLFIILLGSILFIVFYASQNTVNVGTTASKGNEVSWKKNIKSYTSNELTNGYYIKSGNRFYPLTSIDNLYDNNNSITSDFKTSNEKNSMFYGLYNFFFLNTSYKDNIPHINLKNEDDKIVFVGDTIPKMIILKNSIELTVDNKTELDEEIRNYFIFSNLKIEDTPTVLQKGTKTSEVFVRFFILGTYTNDYTMTTDGYMEINFEKNDCGTGMYLIGDKAFFIEQDNSKIEKIVLQDKQEQINMASILLKIAETENEIFKDKIEIAQKVNPSSINRQNCSFYYTIKKGTSIYNVDTSDGLLSALRKGIKILPEKDKLSKDHLRSLPEYGFDTWEDQISTKIIDGTRYYFFNNVNNAYAIQAQDYCNILVKAITDEDFTIF